MMKHLYVHAGVLAILVAILGSCASSSTVVDRSKVTISDNSRVVSRNLLPGSTKYPNVVEHLALAQEVYQAQLALLKERRNTLRSRSRGLSASSFAVFAATTLGVGATAIATNDKNAPDNLRAAGFGALGGLTLGTLLQVFGYMQEDPSAVDGKVRELQSAYDAMLERVRLLGDAGAVEGASANKAGADIAAAIESFMAQAAQIDVKG